jgi:hypothetical protein
MLSHTLRRCAENNHKRWRANPRRFWNFDGPSNPIKRTDEDNPFVTPPAVLFARPVASSSKRRLLDNKRAHPPTPRRIRKAAQHRIVRLLNLIGTILLFCQQAQKGKGRLTDNSGTTPVKIGKLGVKLVKSTRNASVRPNRCPPLKEM